MQNSSGDDRRIVEVDGMVVIPIMIGNSRAFGRCLHIVHFSRNRQNFRHEKHNIKQIPPLP